LDEGIAVTQAGYFDRKLMVRMENGTVAEIQIMTKNLSGAKSGGGHALYVETRAMEVAAGTAKGKALPGQESQALSGHSRMFQQYFDAVRKEGPDVQKTYIKSLNDNVLESLGLTKDQVVKALKSDSSIEMPFAKASVPDSRVQASASLSKENASKGLPTASEVKTEGLSSIKTKATNSSLVKGGLPGSSIHSSYSLATKKSVAQVKESIKDFEPLAESKGRYFTRPKGTQDIDVTKITPTVTRQQGVSSAYELMGKSYSGGGKKRKPISLEDNGDGTYSILDGNSTFANAAASGWGKIPATVKKLNRSKMLDEKVMVGGVEKTIKRKAGDILKDMDKRLDTLESVLGEL
jgi:hypothetical protein